MATAQTENKLAPKTSRVGKKPIVTPKGVTVTVASSEVKVKGPKGELSFGIHPSIHIAQSEGALAITSSAPGRDGARLQGMTRATIANMVQGVTAGYERTLELVGTGYRVELKGTTLTCILGYSHQIEYPLPKGITAEIPKDSKGTILTLFGTDKAVIGQTAATIRGFRPPEPYGGKGVRYKGEKIREKAGKAGK
ncbi:MAG: 50S ribosomal protein L6 [Deltaproteobacteria bacterium]|nr:50S ribosomal protein L6 [Deltaproteobacteria bacterium]